jgi:hypothetical protein
MEVVIMYCSTPSTSIWSRSAGTPSPLLSAIMQNNEIVQRERDRRAVAMAEDVVVAGRRAEIVRRIAERVAAQKRHVARLERERGRQIAQTASVPDADAAGRAEALARRGVIYTMHSADMIRRLRDGAPPLSSF